MGVYWNRPNSPNSPNGIGTNWILSNQAKSVSITIQLFRIANAELQDCNLIYREIRAGLCRILQHFRLPGATVGGAALPVGFVGCLAGRPHITDLRLSSEAVSMDRMPFGKHKGTPLKDLPPDYLRWLSTIELREPLLSAVKEAMADVLIGGSAPSGRSTAVGAATAPPARPAGYSGGSRRPERAKPKLPWLRPESEDLSAYYSAGSEDKIPW